MAKLYYNYSTMGAGKSAQLLQAAYNYTNNGKQVLYFNFILDDRFGQNKIKSRIGIEHEATMFDNGFEFYKNVNMMVLTNLHMKYYSAIFIDECQFLTKDQVMQLCKIVDILGIPVLCYGLRNDYMGKLFEGSKALMCNADIINEIKSICTHKECTKKATHIILYKDGKRTYNGRQTFIGDLEYKSVCRKHFMNYNTNK